MIDISLIFFQSTSFFFFNKFKQNRIFLEIKVISIRTCSYFFLPFGVQRFPGWGCGAFRTATCVRSSLGWGCVCLRETAGGPCPHPLAAVAVGVAFWAA
jgi:hypothetical protein